MTMVSSGEISLGGSATSGGLNRSVNIELGRSATATINMNESAVRGLAGVASGAISMSNFYGKSNDFSFTISANASNVDLRTAAISAGWNQSSRVVCTINSGVTITSNSTGSAAMTISGSFPNGVQLNNNGTILGRGGQGATAGGNAGNAGGPGLSVSTAVSINNVGRISGGGGGGGSGGNASWVVQAEQTYTVTVNGGPGGGGIGNGPAGTASASGTATAGTLLAGGSGGAGNSGTTSCPVGESTGTNFNSGGAGGAGGTFGSAGSTGANASYSGPCPPVNLGSGFAGGAGGAAVNGNSNITWIATGTRNGALN